jgi:carbamoyltransferase
MRMAGNGPARNLCLAGGLGLNALLVSALEQRSGRENVFVQPVAGNAGTAIGAVLNTWHTVYRQAPARPLDTLSLGPATPPRTSSRCWKTASCASAIC